MSCSYVQKTWISAEPVVVSACMRSQLKEMWSVRKDLFILWGSLLLKQEAGIQVGDIIIGVNETDCKWGDHTFVVSLIRNTETCVTLDIVTPKSLKEIAEIYNVKLARDEQIVTSDYSGSAGSSSSSCSSSRKSSLKGVYSLTGSTSSGSRPGTPSCHSAVLEMGNESILW